MPADESKRPLTYQFRVRDKHAAELRRQSRAVNVVWNYCNETQRRAIQDHRWLSAFELMRLTAGAGPLLGLHAHTVQRVCSVYAKSLRVHKRPWLRWRGRKSLGWVPFNTDSVAFDGSAFVFRSRLYETMHVRELGTDQHFGAGSFSQDARGRWYLNVPVEAPTRPSGAKEVGIDLGLKALATLSSGETLPAPQLYRASEAALAIAQRARKSARVRRIHAKIANRRADYLHKASARIARANGLIVVGDVSPSKLVKTSMAKSVLDAGWADFKRMLAYKALRHGATFVEVPEAYTTQTCSACGSLPPGRPEGIAGLGIRGWTCGDCGAVHDRDVNAARNILRLGHQALAEGAA